MRQRDSIWEEGNTWEIVFVHLGCFNKITEWVAYKQSQCISFFKKRFYLSILGRGREGERERGKHHCVVASHVPLVGDLACNPGMCPDWELNRWPFGSQAGTQSTEPHQPGQMYFFFETMFLCQLRNNKLMYFFLFL